MWVMYDLVLIAGWVLCNRGRSENLTTSKSIPCKDHKVVWPQPVVSRFDMFDGLGLENTRFKCIISVKYKVNKQSNLVFPVLLLGWPCVVNRMLKSSNYRPVFPALLLDWPCVVDRMLKSSNYRPVFPALLLGWPCVVDRMLKSSNYHPDITTLVTYLPVTN